MAEKRKLQDKYFRRAKREGYVARSAYKLLEINKRRKLISKGDRVLDLGCAPGSWLQVAEQIIGPEGTLVGIDLKPVNLPLGPNVRTIVGDFTRTTAAELLGGEDELFDVVISDMAPSTTGHGDHFISERLCQSIIDALPDLLKPRGTCTMKVLEGETFPALIGRMKQVFRIAGAIKPDACREVSRETYVYGIGFRPHRVRVKDGPDRGAMPEPTPGWGD
ncbi:MAG: RlmE family RNA methyltransferase [Phycisphaerales bacterium]